jgi:hypothetical protein
LLLSLHVVANSPTHISGPPPPPPFSSPAQTAARPATKQ